MMSSRWMLVEAIVLAIIGLCFIAFAIMGNHDLTEQVVDLAAGTLLLGTAWIAMEIREIIIHVIEEDNNDE